MNSTPTLVLAPEAQINLRKQTRLIGRLVHFLIKFLQNKLQITCSGLSLDVGRLQSWESLGVTTEFITRRLLHPCITCSFLKQTRRKAALSGPKTGSIRLKQNCNCYTTCIKYIGKLSTSTGPATQTYHRSAAKVASSSFM